MDKMVNKIYKTTLDSVMQLAGSKELSRALLIFRKLLLKNRLLLLHFTSARLKATKFAIAQARRVWSSAAAYSSIEHKMRVLNSIQLSVKLQNMTLSQIWNLFVVNI